MIAQGEALRLADALEISSNHGMRREAAAELRRLHQFAEDQIGRATAAEAALQMTRATYALKIDRLVAQRDALLEALRQIVGQHGQWNNGMWAANIARAAIKAAKENT